MQGKKRQSACDNTSAILICGFIMAGLAFVVGYSMASKSETKFAEQESLAIRHREVAIRRLIDQCEREVSKKRGRLSAMSKEVQDLDDEKTQLKARNDDLFQQNELQESDISRCIEEGEEQRRHWTEKDEENHQKMLELIQGNLELHGQVRKSQQTKGMRHVLLSQALSRARHSNFMARVVMGMPAPPDDYEDNLLEKWASQLKRGVVAPLHAHESQTLNATIKEWKVFEFHPETHTEIFFQKSKDDGQVERPEWLGRKGTQPVQQGIVFSQMNEKSRFRLEQAIRALYPYAFCALRHKTANFTYPNEWRRNSNNIKLGTKVSKEDQAKLPLVQSAGVIDTPLINFCSQCTPTASTAEFKLACLGDTVDVDGNTNDGHYGGYQFWQMRSRIRLQPGFHAMKKTFLDAKGLAGKKYAAVALKTGATLQRRCNGLPKQLPSRHFFWLAGNFPKRTVPQLLSNVSAKAQCRPRPDQAAQAVKSFLQRIGDVDALYVAVYDEGDVEKLKAIQALHKNVVFHAAASVDEDAVDMLVFAGASHILVNAYSDYSQVVTEEFLLNNALSPERVYFF